MIKGKCLLLSAFSSHIYIYLYVTNRKVGVHKVEFAALEVLVEEVVHESYLDPQPMDSGPQHRVQEHREHQVQRGVFTHSLMGGTVYSYIDLWLYYHTNHTPNSY